MKNIAFVLIIAAMLTIFSGCQSLVNQPALDPAAEKGGSGSSDQVDEDLPDGEDNIPGDNINTDTNVPAEDGKLPDGQIIDKGDQPAEGKAPAGFAYNMIKYEILGNVPDELAALVEEKKMTAAAEVIQEGADYRIALISLGERPTGGYSIKITEVADIENGKATVRYRKVAPAPDAMVTQAITYPYVVLKIEAGLPVVFEEAAASDDKQE